MKFLGVVSFLLLMSTNCFADFLDCKGNVFSRWDDGRIAFEKTRIAALPNFGTEMSVKVVNGQLVFETKNTEDDWVYYSEVDRFDQVYISAFRPKPLELNYADMRLDRETFFKYEDKALVGFNLVCRL